MRQPGLFAAAEIVVVGARIAVRSGGDSSCEETVPSARDVLKAKNMSDRKRCICSTLAEGPAPGSIGPGDACGLLSARGAYSDVRAYMCW